MAYPSKERYSVVRAAPKPRKPPKKVVKQPRRTY